MNAAHRSLVLSLAAIALCACGARHEQTQAPPPVEDTVFGDTVDAIDKARSVETTTLQHKEDLDRAMEAAESGSN